MTSYAHSAINNVSDIVAIADYAGSYFFSPDTMRFFSSRTLQGVRAIEGSHCAPGHRYLFLTSERHGPVGTPRHYTVRMITLGKSEDNRGTVEIDTVSDYFSRADLARDYMHNYAIELKNG